MPPETSTPFAFQAGVAGLIDDVVATMSSTHDTLIRTWGKKRRSGVSWWIFGSPLAALVAKARGRSWGPGVTGPIDVGWQRLAALCEAGDASLPASLPDGYLEDMRAFADQFPVPTLVIAFCDISDPEAHQ